jgi:hypothetical protein
MPISMCGHINAPIMWTIEPSIGAYLTFLRLYDDSPIPDVLTGTLDYFQGL